MPIINKGAYVLAEPGGRCTVLSMDGSEIDLFGKFTSIKTTAVDTYNDIMDGLTEKAVEHPAAFQLVLGVAVTALLGSLAVAAVGVAAGLTGGLALAVMAGAAGFARAAVETGIYTATSFLTDTVTGSHRSNEDYVKGLAFSGGVGFVTGALSYLNPTISFTPGPSFAMADGGTMAVAIPTIVTNVADTVLVLDKALAVSTVLSAAMGAGGGKPDKEGIQIERKEDVSVGELVEQIPDEYKQNFKCDKFADELKKLLDKRGIEGKKFEINSRYSQYLYSDKNGCISENGKHWAVKIGDKVYDNLNPNGIDIKKWLADLGYYDYPDGFVIPSWLKP